MAGFVKFAASPKVSRCKRDGFLREQKLRQQKAAVSR
jgi:hypothetical protein